MQFTPIQGSTPPAEVLLLNAATAEEPDEYMYMTGRRCEDGTWRSNVDGREIIPQSWCRITRDN